MNSNAKIFFSVLEIAVITGVLVLLFKSKSEPKKIIL